MPVTTGQNPASEPAPAPRTQPALWLTRRALALFAVLAVLVISYANSLRVYLDTSRENAENRAKIAASEAHMRELNAELQRWDDPEYVKTQARDRLGWVVPGETGYRVIGHDGKPVGARIDTEINPAPTEHKAVWWERLGGSIDVADVPLPERPGKQPAPKPSSSPLPPLTDGDNTASPTPSPSPTPSKKAGKTKPTKKAE